MKPLPAAPALRRAVLPALAALLAASPAAAWNSVGHRTVALAAESILFTRSPGAWRTLRALIGTASLADIADCADDIGYKDPSFRCAGIFPLPPPNTPRGTLAGSKPWHYVSLPIARPPSRVYFTSAAEAAYYCPGGVDCVTEQIPLQTQVLGAPRMPLQERQWALMFLVHLVGDIHQPMHCGSDNDAGGTEKFVRVGERRMNLHSYWDSMLTSETWEEQRLVDPNSRHAGHIAMQAQTYFDSVLAEEDSVSAAMSESYQLARDLVYRDYDARAYVQRTAEPVYESTYYLTNSEVVYDRLRRAGARLAAALHSALGTVDTQPVP